MDHIPAGAALLRTTDDMLALFGTPASSVSNEYAPIPESDHTYAHGIGFASRNEDGRLARVTVCRKR